MLLDYNNLIIKSFHFLPSHSHDSALDISISAQKAINILVKYSILHVLPPVPFSLLPKTDLWPK